MSYQLDVDEQVFSKEDLKRFDLFFIEKGYTIFKNRDDFTFMPALDRLYVKNNYKEKVFLKTSVFLNKKESTDILSSENGYFTNFKFEKKVSVFYFSGIQKDKINQLKKQLSHSVSTKSMWSVLLLKSAYATNSICEKFSGIKSAIEEKNHDGVFYATWGCAKGSVLGLWNATGGALVDLSKLAISTSEATLMVMYCSLDLPGERTKCKKWSTQLFVSAEQNFTQISNLILNSREIINQLLPSFKNANNEVQAKINCEIVSTLITSGFLIYATFGSNTPTLAFQIQQILQKMNLAKLEISETLASQIKNISVLPSAVVQSLGKVNPEALKNLTDAFSKYNLSRSNNIKAIANYEGFKLDLQTFKSLQKSNHADEVAEHLGGEHYTNLLEKFINSNADEMARKYRQHEQVAKLTSLEHSTSLAAYRKSLDEADKIMENFIQTKPVMSKEEKMLLRTTLAAERTKITCFASQKPELRSSIQNQKPTAPRGVSSTAN
ncbi:MAG: hypothetical protein H7328_09055 [Bdellovibrio sp.]|nr:hypothetical protein [Bdellovibrio sp.]